MARLVRTLRTRLTKRADKDTGAIHAARLREFADMLRQESAMAITTGHS